MTDYLDRERCEECGRLDGIYYGFSDEQLAEYTDLLGNRALDLLNAHLDGTTTEARAANADLIGFDAVHTEDYAILMTIQVVLDAVRKANRTRT